MGPGYRPQRSTTKKLKMISSDAHLRYIQLEPRPEALMERKTKTLNLRVTPELKELVRVAAAHDHRTVSNFIEVLVREHCDRRGVGIDQKSARPPLSS